MYVTSVFEILLLCSTFCPNVPNAAVDCLILLLMSSESLRSLVNMLFKVLEICAEREVFVVV
jgi:hypothetical protein